MEQAEANSFLIGYFILSLESCGDNKKKFMSGVGGKRFSWFTEET